MLPIFKVVAVDILYSIFYPLVRASNASLENKRLQYRITRELMLEKCSFTELNFTLKTGSLLTKARKQSTRK